MRILHTESSLGWAGRRSALTEAPAYGVGIIKLPIERKVEDAMVDAMIRVFADAIQASSAPPRASARSD